MSKTETTLEIGRKALFNHCDMGWIDIEIRGKAPIGSFYFGKLLKVYHKDVRLLDSTNAGVALLSQGRDVDVFVQPQDLIKYK